MMEVKTKAGTIKIRENADPGSPGVCVMLQPKGSEVEIDLAYIELKNDPEYRLDSTTTDEDVFVYMYGDPYSEDYTGAARIRRCDVVNALQIPEN